MEEVKAAEAAADEDAAAAEEEEEEEEPSRAVTGGAGAGRRVVAFPRTLRCTGTEGRFEGAITEFSWPTWVGLERFIPLGTRGRMGSELALNQQVGGKFRRLTGKGPESYHFTSPHLTLLL